MIVKKLLIATALTVATLPFAAAHAATLTTSFAAWRAGVGGSYTSTPLTGLFDPFALTLPTTSVVTFADGLAASLSTPAQITEPQNGFPYALPDGSSPDLLIPVDGAGNQVRIETITPGTGSISAFGFSVVPFSSSGFGKTPQTFTFTVTLASGQSIASSVAGASLNTGATAAPAFFGYYGGSASALTITSTDPNGFAVFNFVDVPEPASMALVLMGLGMAGLVRRRA